MLSWVINLPPIRSVGMHWLIPVVSNRYNNNTWIWVLADTSTNTDTHPRNIRHDPDGWSLSRVVACMLFTSSRLLAFNICAVGAAGNLILVKPHIIYNWQRLVIQSDEMSHSLCYFNCLWVLSCHSTPEFWVLWFQCPPVGHGLYIHHTDMHAI